MRLGFFPHWPIHWRKAFAFLVIMYIDGTAFGASWWNTVSSAKPPDPVGAAICPSGGLQMELLYPECTKHCPQTKNPPCGTHPHRLALLKSQ
jgi:hypothetical protein